MVNTNPWAPLPKASAAVWLNRAVQVTASLGTQSVMVPSDTGWGELTRVATGSVELHPTYRPHTHSINELCLALSGTAVIVLGEHSYRLDAPRLVVLCAGVSHAEGRLDNHPYDLMWIGLGSEGINYASFSSHRPGAGWRIRFRLSLAGRGRRLLHRFSRQWRPTPRDWPLLQNELLEALVELQATALGGGTKPLPTRDRKPSVIESIQRYLMSHLTESLRLDKVAHMVRLSPNYINTVFRQETGTTIHAWILEQRMKNSMDLCQQTDLPINVIALKSGFKDPLYFSKAFRLRFGISPTEARSRSRADVAKSTA